MKMQITCLILLAMLLVASVATIMPAFCQTTLNTVPTSQPSNAEVKTPIMMNLNLSSLLMSLGYTHENISSIPADLLVKLIRSQNQTYTSSPNNFQDLPTLYPARPTTYISGPIKEPNLNATYISDPNKAPTNLNSSGNYSMDTQFPHIGARACLIVSIWTYQSLPDLYQWVHPEYERLLSEVNNYGHYNQVVTLTQSDATYYNVYNWLLWLCLSYDNVDVYIDGHGGGCFAMGWYYGYFCWDAVGWGGLINPWCVLFPADLYSHYESGYYADFSTLQLSWVGCCDGWVFDDVCLNPGGEAIHYRAFMGADGDVSAAYGEDFLTNANNPAISFDNPYYYNLYTSEYCWNNAATNNNPGGYSPYQYADTDSGNGILNPCFITVDAYDDQYNAVNAPVYLDGQIVGYSPCTFSVSPYTTHSLYMTNVYDYYALTAEFSYVSAAGMVIQ